jgi:hypothetical protein
MTFRIRTKGGLVDTVRTTDEISFNGTHHYAMDTPAHLQSGEVTTTTDVVTPGFRRKMNGGAIVNNPFHSRTVKRNPHYSGTSARRKSGSGSTIQWYTGDNLYGNGPDPKSPPSVDVEALKALAGTSAASKVLKPDIDGLVEIAEFRQAVSLFNVKRLVLDAHLNKLGKYFFGKRKYTAKELAKMLSNNWLKYRYGIMPLVRLCDQALHLGKEPKPLRLVARGSASDSASKFDTSSQTGFFWRVDYGIQQNLQVDVRAGILYEIISSHNRYGFNFSDLPAAAWELVPWSFVVDWGFNVGNWIRSVTPKVGARVLATWTSVKSEHDIAVTQSSVWVASSSTYEEVQAPSGGWEYHCTDKRRAPGISTKIVFDKRSFKAIPTDKRLIDSIALTLQKLGS